MSVPASHELNIDLKADIAGVRAAIKRAKYDVIRWMIGMAFFQVGAILMVPTPCAH